MILCVISPNFCQNQTFECKIRPFSDLFVQKCPISDQSPKKSDLYGTLGLKNKTEKNKDDTDKGTALSEMVRPAFWVKFFILGLIELIF